VNAGRSSLAVRRRLTQSGRPLGKWINHFWCSGGSPNRTRRKKHPARHLSHFPRPSRVVQPQFTKQYSFVDQARWYPTEVAWAKPRVGPNGLSPQQQQSQQQPRQQQVFLVIGPTVYVISRHCCASKDSLKAGRRRTYDVLDPST
jgi:hypothetical protein